VGGPNRAAPPSGHYAQRTTVYYRVHPACLGAASPRHAYLIQRATHSLDSFGAETGCAADFRQYMEAYFDQKWDER
jgi:hypothetical protein